MVLITPRLVRPLDPDEVPPLPTRPASSSFPVKTTRPETSGRTLRRAPGPRGETATADASGQEATSAAATS